MRYLLLLLLASCTVGPVDPNNPGTLVAVPRAEAVGEFDGHFQAKYGEIPLTARFLVRGNGSCVAQPIPPYLVFAGDAYFIVEPIPTEESRAASDLAAGRIAVYRDGLPGGLNMPGSAARIDAPRTPITYGHSSNGGNR